MTAADAVWCAGVCALAGLLLIGPLRWWRRWLDRRAERADRARARALRAAQRRVTFRTVRFPDEEEDDR